MEKQAYYVQMSDGQEIHVKTFTPPGKIRGHIHVLHGMAEHSGRYEKYALELERFGYFVSMHDHRGHGLTVDRGGQLGFFADNRGFERIVEDVFEVIDKVRKEQHLPRTILFGHSMGSFIARRYAQLYSDTLQGLIICGTGTFTPAHAIGNQLANFLATTKGKRTPSELMNKLSFGSFNKSILQPATAFDWLTRDAEIVQHYMDDPKCGYIASNQFFADLTYGIRLVSKLEEIEKIRPQLPILLISGSEDPVGAYGKGVYKVARQLQKGGLEDVCVYLFEGMRHEILNETNKEQVYEVIKRWLRNEKKL